MYNTFITIQIILKLKKIQAIIVSSDFVKTKHYLIEHVKKPQALCQPAAEVDKQKCAQLLHRAVGASCRLAQQLLHLQQSQLTATVTAVTACIRPSDYEYQEASILNRLTTTQTQTSVNW
ncbi:hypothetical protein T11_8708 [Trichinella zimbabwensis]|uniref:Uncharacterized protein n=1 Tax=Trichinella zimbabwensis TaxID=268475 RepID=A0A0V1H979_9BILA|nr:hypothetical protein T11_8708 [Trichinella zimbabwensis]